MPHPRTNSQTISWFWDLYQRQLLDLNPPYQRRSVWNQAYREYFIDTILLEFPAPAIFLYQEIEENGRTKYHVVDGKQRLLTVFAFVKDEFPVGDKAQLTALRGKYFSQLGDLKQKFWGYPFTVEYLPTVDEGIINNIFDRINRNVAKLTPQELRHARFDGVFIGVTESLAEWLAAKLPDFPRITESSRKQMKDVEFVAYLLLLLEEGPKGYSIEDLDKAFSDRDTSWEKRQSVEEQFRKTTEELRKIVEHAEGAFIRSSRLRNQADFYSLFGAVSALLLESRVPQPAIAAARLATFLNVVEHEQLRVGSPDAIAYYEAARSASNDATPRSTRIRMIRKVLLGEFNA